MRKSTDCSAKLCSHQDKSIIGVIAVVMKFLGAEFILWSPVEKFDFFWIVENLLEIHGVLSNVSFQFNDLGVYLKVVSSRIDKLPYFDVLEVVSKFSEFFWVFRQPSLQPLMYWFMLIL